MIPHSYRGFPKRMMEKTADKVEYAVIIQRLERDGIKKRRFGILFFQ